MAQKDSHSPDIAATPARCTKPDASATADMHTHVAWLTRELEECKERLRLFHERSPLPSHFLDQEGRLLDVNHAWLLLLGRHRDDVIGHWIGDFLTEECRAKFPATFARFLESGEVRGCEFSLVHESGEVVLVAVDGSVVRSANKEFLHTHCLLRNITRERAQMRTVVESEAQYRTMFDDAAIPIAIARDLKIIYANKAQAQSLGLENREKLIGRHVVSFVAPHCALNFTDRARRRLNGEQVENQYEVDMLRVDGSEFTALATVSQITLPDGPAILGFFQDISDRKDMENALRRSENRFRMLFDEIPSIAVQGYAQDRTVVYWNNASTELYGYTREEALGHKLEQLIIPEPMRLDAVQAVTRWVERDIPIPPGELGLMRKDGTIVPVYSSHVLQRLEDGTCEMYCLDLDMSDLIRTRDELCRAKDAAEAANQAKGEFLANMSHEIRTPMNGVLGMLQLLRDGGLSGELNEFVNMAHSAAKRLLSLLNDILDFSRLDSGKLTLRKSPFGMDEVLHSVIAMFRQACQSKDLWLEYTVDPAIPPVLLGDEARLRQVLFNIVGNAVKFTRSGGIMVQAWMRKTPESSDHVRVYISVKDTGVGIPDDKQAIVFDRFTQTDASYTRQHEGAGLGLAIVKRIVQLMGGSISVDSELGRGTTMCWDARFEVPTTPVPLFQTEPKEIVPLQATGPVRILLADDDIIGLMACRTMLERRGYDVTCVNHGLDVVLRLRTEPFDCVLMDIQMPNMDGVDATTTIRGDKELGERANVPIIALTAYAMAGDREKFLAAGMDGYVSKPVNEVELLRAIESAMATRSRHPAL